jgi:hypothetical protein
MMYPNPYQMPGMQSPLQSQYAPYQQQIFGGLLGQQQQQPMPQQAQPGLMNAAANQPQRMPQGPVPVAKQKWIDRSQQTMQQFAPGSAQYQNAQARLGVAMGTPEARAAEAQRNQQNQAWMADNPARPRYYTDAMAQAQRQGFEGRYRDRLTTTAGLENAPGRERAQSLLSDPAAFENAFNDYWAKSGQGYEGRSDYLKAPGAADLRWESGTSQTGDPRLRMVDTRIGANVPGNGSVFGTGNPFSPEFAQFLQNGYTSGAANRLPNAGTPQASMQTFQGQNIGMPDLTGLRDQLNQPQWQQMQAQQGAVNPMPWLNRQIGTQLGMQAQQYLPSNMMRR